MLKHSGCEGKLAMNLSPLYSLKTMSISINVDGIGFGVAELVRNTGKLTSVYFECQKCKETVTKIADVVCECSVCQENKPVSEILSTKEIPVICSSCLEALKGDTVEELPDKIKEVKMYIFLPKDTKSKSVESLLKTEMKSFLR